MNPTVDLQSKPSARGRKPSIPWLVPLLASGAVAFAGVANASTPWHEAPEIQQLYEAAKKEGQVTLWGTNPREVGWIPAAFNRQFPDITVRVMGDNDIVTKAIAEARAGRHELDVFWASLTMVVPVAQRNLLARTDWQGFDIPEDYIALDGQLAYTNNIVYAVAYNRNLVEAADVPDKWEELTDSKYRGKMVANQFLLPRMIAGLGMVWGEQKAVAFARELTANGVMLTRAPREPLLQSGERLFAVAEIETWPKLWARDGMPIDFVIPEPIVAGQFGAAVMARAPNPNAARLLAGWLASPEGKAAREDAVMATDYRPGTTNPEVQKLLASDPVIVHDTVEGMQERERLIGVLGPIVAGQAR